MLEAEHDKRMLWSARAKGALRGVNFRYGSSVLNAYFVRHGPLRWLPLVLAVAIVSTLVGSPGISQVTINAPTGQLRRIHHPWGRFEPGAWALVKEVAESYAPHGKLVAETELKTTLVGIDLEGVTLQIEPKVSVGGKPMPVVARQVRQGFHGEPLDQTIRLIEDKETVIQFLGRPLACRQQKIQVEGVSTRSEVTLFYGSVPPYIYRRESKVTKLEDGTEVSSQVWEVVGRSCRLLGLIQDTYQVKISQKTAQGTRITLATISPEVPGGLLTQTTMEFNAGGELVQKVNSELLEYGYEHKAPRGILRLWRPRPFRN